MPRTEARTSHYDPRPSPVHRGGDLDAAYRRAGLEPPTPGAAIAELVYAAPTVAVEVDRIAHGALTTTEDAPAYYEQALAAVTRAMAADALRSAYYAAEQAAAEAALPEAHARAARDLGPAFTAAVTKLGKAAAKLPEHPFDLDAVVATDATRAMKDAAAALADLAVYAALYPTAGIDTGTTPAMARLLPVLDVPDVAQEVMERSGLDGFGSALNADECRATGTYALRQLARDADRDGLDHALVDLARGHYDGLGFALATGDAQVWDRAERVHRAHVQVRAERAYRAATGVVL